MSFSVEDILGEFVEASHVPARSGPRLRHRSWHWQPYRGLEPFAKPTIRNVYAFPRMVPALRDPVYTVAVETCPDCGLRVELRPGQTAGFTARFHIGGRYGRCPTGARVAS